MNCVFQRVHLFRSVQLGKAGLSNGNKYLKNKSIT